MGLSTDSVSQATRLVNYGLGTCQVMANAQTGGLMHGKLLNLFRREKGHLKGFLAHL